MSWYRCEASLRSSPKVARLARRLGIPTAHARGLLTGLWAWACEARPSGDLTGLDAVDLAYAAEWEGDAPTLVAALVECRLVDVGDDGGWALHDWADRAEGYHRARVDARRREADRERKAVARAVRTVSADRPQTSADVRTVSADVRAVSRGAARAGGDLGSGRSEAPSGSSSEDGPGGVRPGMDGAKRPVSARVQDVSADVRGHSADRPQTSADARAGEERTERTERTGEDGEEIGEESSVASASPRRRSTPRVRSADSDTSPPVLVYPCTGPVAMWTLTQAQLDRWRELYVGVAVDVELRKALAYVEAGRRKTAAGMPRFLSGWLGRANDRGGRGPTPAARDYRREAELAREERLRAVYEERGILPREDAPGLRAIQGGGP